MRTLKFIVDKLNISRDPSCDFSGLVPGTEGYLQAEFSFSKEWDDCVKIAAFYDNKNEYSVMLEDGKSCIIPNEAADRPAFGVRVYGKSTKHKIVTNKEIVIQNGR